MNTVTFTRKELYDLVWAESILSLSKKYKISDVGLRKICLRMDIPVPNQGHWAKSKAGMRVSVKPLLKGLAGREQVTLLLRQGTDEGNLGGSSPITILRKEIESVPNLPITVPSKLSAPDKLIISAKHALTNKELRYSRHKGVFITRNGALDIRVSLQNLDRALLFMDTLIKLLRIRDHDVIVGSEDTYALVYNQKIEISFREKLKRVKSNDHWSGLDYQASGILSFRIGKYSFTRQSLLGTKPAYGN